MWAQMVNQNSPFYTGTLWEKLGQNGQDTDSNASLAHGWATAPVSAFSSYLLGIQPTAPGYITWSIAPQPGTLNWAQGQVPTPSGTPVVSRWQAGSNASSFELTMSAPAGTAGTVAVPELGASCVIAEDGQIVWAGDAPVGSVSATETNGSVVFANVSGAHTFAWVASPTSPDVCTLTKEYVDGSANYQKLTPIQQKVVDASRGNRGRAGDPPLPRRRPRSASALLGEGVGGEELGEDRDDGAFSVRGCDGVRPGQHFRVGVRHRE